MKLKELYQAVIETGIAHDLRGREHVEKLLAEEREKYEKLDTDEREFFDVDRLFNPYSDTRILTGDPGTDVRRAIVGIDMEVGEILLAHLLNKDQGKKIDLVIAHHPEGYALTRLFDVMKLQADLMSLYGITVSVAEKLMEKRISEVERRLMPINHNRAVDVARLLGLPMMSIHTPADNCVTSYLTQLFDAEKPVRLKDLLKLLRAIPEYRKSVALQLPPKIVSGSEDNRCGKIYVDMTGGTEGSKEVFDKFASSGVSTLVVMHISEEHLENAKKANLNVIVAGHIASDTLGLNLICDEVEKRTELDFISISGFERIRRLG